MTSLKDLPQPARAGEPIVGRRFLREIENPSDPAGRPRNTSASPGLRRPHDGIAEQQPAFLRTTARPLLQTSSTSAAARSAIYSRYSSRDVSVLDDHSTSTRNPSELRPTRAARSAQPSPSGQMECERVIHRLIGSRFFGLDAGSIGGGARRDLTRSEYPASLSFSANFGRTPVGTISPSTFVISSQFPESFKREDLLHRDDFALPSR